MIALRCDSKPSLVGSWDWDVVADRITADPAFARLYGVDPDDAARGTAIERFFGGIHPDDLPRVQAEIAEALASGAPLYGVNTGFGKLAQTSIAPEALAALQLNLLRSHAAGVGKKLAPRSHGFPGPTGALDLFSCSVTLLRGAGLCPGVDAAGDGMTSEAVRAILSGGVPVPFTDTALGQLLACIGVAKSQDGRKTLGLLSEYGLCAASAPPAAAGEA
jgi:hypothetical protein